MQRCPGGLEGRGAPLERQSEAEREGFEPSRELSAPYSLSRRVPSAARPPLREDLDSMRRLVLLAVAILAVLLVLAQFLVPPLLEHRVEQRLEKAGGTATVDLTAFPSERLLFDEGDGIKVRAQGITTQLVSPTSKVFHNLDGFDDVDVRVTDMRSGPFQVQSFGLERRGARPYRATVRATVTAADLATFAGTMLGGQFGGLLGTLGGSIIPFGDQQIPLQLAADLRSDGGRPQALNVDGTIAGLPAGPLIEALAGALGGRF
jgi:hypothetical protein